MKKFALFFLLAGTQFAQQSPDQTASPERQEPVKKVSPVVAFWLPVFLESVQGDKDMKLPPADLQVAPGMTWSPSGSAFPRTNLLTAGFGLKKVSGLLRPAAAVTVSRPILQGKLGAKDDIRTSSIPGGQTSLGIRVQESWRMGFMGELPFGLSKTFELGPGFRYTSIPVQAVQATNGNIVRAVELGKLTLKTAYVRGTWQPAWVGLTFYAGKTFHRQFGDPWIFGIGPSFEFGGR